MSGNAWEWVWDWYAASYPNTAETNPTGPSTGTKKIVRGGGWGVNTTSLFYLRVAYRLEDVAVNGRANDVGLRVVRSL